MANHRRMRNKSNNRTATLAVVIFMVVIGLVGLLVWLLTPSDSSVLPEKEQYAVQTGPLEGLEIKRDTQHGREEFHYLLNGTPAFDRSGGNGSVYLENCDGNTGFMRVVYQLENGEVVYVSPVLVPNSSLTTDELNVSMESGEYAAEALIYVYSSADADDYIDCFEENITITVG